MQVFESVSFSFLKDYIARSNDRYEIMNTVRLESNENFCETVAKENQNCIIPIE
ncbi:hypothetical protein LPTSP1_03220 [Leptospira johnsonii]|uniref:Uncharacterized protein n=1 Tax=Leptospira johnsonii TaxID=1917820 RepID=A0A2P2CY71_9LEPT|nr:hypothetical protein LPTSP1_03220 [Leptospira johnsonii]